MTGAAFPMPPRIEIVEVAPRDGLQNEANILPTEDKLYLIERLSDAGLRRIEATSFVSPSRVPQMADAEDLMSRLARRPEVRYSGLVLSLRGAQRAIASGCDELTYVVVASETFSRRNQAQGVAESLEQWRRIADLSHAHSRRCSLLIGAAFGCPFEGRVDPARVLDIAAEGAECEPAEIGLADTIGVAVPSQVLELFGRLAIRLPAVTRRAHFHNTRNTGYANAYAALLAGVAVIDASAGGIGGCPFAPRATGNIATEDLLYMLNRMGIEHGVDAGIVAALDPWLLEHLGHVVPAQSGKAGEWPPRGKLGALTVDGA